MTSHTFPLQDQKEIEGADKGETGLIREDLEGEIWIAVQQDSGGYHHSLDFILIH